MTTITTTPAPGKIVEGQPYTCEICGITFSSFATYTRRDAQHNAVRRAAVDAQPVDTNLDAGEGLTLTASNGWNGGSSRPAPATVEPTPDDEVEAWLISLGRKVDHGEVTPELAAAARAWAARYVGDFEFMLDMRKAARPGGRFTDGMAKGTLNCWRAEVNRRPKAKPTTTNPQPANDYEPKKGDIHIVGGDYYRVHLGQRSGNHYAVKADIIAEAVWNDDRTKIVEPGIVEWDLAKGMIFKLTKETLATAEAAKAFGHLVGRCCFCSTAIDTPESTAVGYGPTCAAKHGLPWGSTAQKVG